MSYRHPQNHQYGATSDLSLNDLREIMSWLAKGDVEHLEFAAQLVDGFPCERDGCLGDPWIVHAVSSGNLDSVNWMIDRRVDVQPYVADGFPPLMVCLGLDCEDKHQILKALLLAGADVNVQGINGWTPLHFAAIRDDEDAMRILLNAGADRAMTTGVDYDATAEQEARNLGHLKSAEFISKFRRR